MPEITPDELPTLPPRPDEEDIAGPGDGPSRTFPRMDVARKLQRQVTFLEAFARLGVVTSAAKVAGVTTRLVYSYWRKDPLFEAAFQEAGHEAADVVEEELRRRGVDGYDDPVIHQGMPTYIEDEHGNRTLLTIKKYSDGCLLALIKARKPEQFRERIHQEVEVKGGSGVLVVPVTPDAAAWEQAATEQQARFRKTDEPPKQ